MNKLFGWEYIVFHRDYKGDTIKRVRTFPNGQKYVRDSINVYFIHGVEKKLESHWGKIPFRRIT